MKIGVDMFLAQHRDRSPAGAYAAGLVRQLVSQYTEHEWNLYFHESLGGLADDWQQWAKVHRAPSASLGGAPNGQKVLAHSNDNVDVWLTTAAVDRHGEYVPPSASVGGVRLAGLLVDLAPIFAPDRFLSRRLAVERYRQSVLVLPRYDVLLTVSESTRLDCTRSLGIDEEKVVAIGVAGDANFFPSDRGRSLAEATPLLLSSAIEKPFVLCLSGDDEDRSIAVMAAALEHLSTPQAQACQYVVLSRLSAEQRGAWQMELKRRGLGRRLLLVDAESNERRRLLCQHCAALVDGEPYEGSGLPLLYALQCGVPAIVDRRSSHAALVEQVALAEVDQPFHLAAKLDQVLADVERLDSLRMAGPVAAARHSMAVVAERAMRALEATTRVGWALPTIASEKGGQCPPHWNRNTRTRPALAFFSPLLPQRTGIADYSERLLAALKQHFRIDLYHDEGYLPQLSVTAAEFGCRDRRLFECFSRAAEYAGIVYQMANTHFCAYVYDTLLKHRGVVVLHDFALPEFHLGYALRPGAPADFLAAEIAFESAALVDEYRSSSDAWRAEPGGLAQACTRRGLTFNRRILEAAGIVVVHDGWGAEQIARLHPHLADRVRVIPHGAAVYTVTAEKKRALRERFGFQQDELILSCFGILNGAKYHSEAIESLAALQHEFPTARLIFVGGDLNEGREQLKAAELGVGERVRFFGHAPMETFLELMSITDLAMNLRRPPTRGETSGALLTLLSAGVPTIVTDVDTFASYPDSVVQKIGPLDREDHSLQHVIRSLLNEPSRRRELGRAATNYVAEIHNWPRVASLYAEAVASARESTSIRGRPRVVDGPRFATHAA